MRFSLIGGSGALGQVLTESMLLAGHEVTVWGRSSAHTLDVTKPAVGVSPVDADCVAYLAWATADRSAAAQSLHVDAASLWARCAAEQGTRFIFVSTVLAAYDAASVYGRMKFHAEQKIRESGGISLRVGLVVDDGYPTLFATRLRRMVKRAPWLARTAAWPTQPVSGARVAASVINEAHAESTQDLRPLWVAPLETTPLAHILDPSTEPTPWDGVSSAIGLAARFVPSVRGPVGRYSDALRGLQPKEDAAEGARQPVDGPIGSEEWKNGLAPEAH